MAQTVEERRVFARNYMREQRVRDPEGVRAYRNAWVKTNPEKVAATQRRSWLRRKDNPLRKRMQFHSALRCRYGLEVGEFDRLLIEQAGRCAICREPLVRQLVDHNHKTGKARGLLCDGCNSYVGHLENDSKREAALRYLSEHEDE